jgi:hypothetical protein
MLILMKKYAVAAALGVSLVGSAFAGSACSQLSGHWAGTVTNAFGQQYNATAQISYAPQSHAVYIQYSPSFPGGGPLYGSCNNGNLSFDGGQITGKTNGATLNYSGTYTSGQLSKFS